MATVPELAVEPAATVSAVPVCLKSAATVCTPADAATVTVVATLDACESVAVTVAAPPFSEIDEDDSANVTDGAIVVVRDRARALRRAPASRFVGPLSATFTVSFGSSTASPVTVTETVPLVAPAAKVSVPAASAV